jgi:antibiotic biosynthesis monooxygenase (ABM) superfamily enzyme
VPNDLFPFDLVFTDSLLQDIGDEVEAPIIFGFCHEDVTAAWRGHVARRRLWVIEEPDQ